MSGPQRGREGPDRIVGGLHPVRELLRARTPVRRVLVARTRHDTPVLDEIVSLAAAVGVPVEPVDRDDLDRREPGLVHQGVLAVAGPFPYTDLDGALVAAGDDPALLVALDGLTDPHNLGSIARTAHAVGAHGLVLPARRAAGVSPAVEKAAAGALAHLAVARVVNLVRALEECKQRGLWVVGLDGQGPDPLGDCALLPEPLVLVFGAEGAGLARLVRRTCDAVVHLPMRGAVASLNASVAAGVALYEVLRHRAAEAR